MSASFLSFFGTCIHVNFIKKKQECRRNGVHDATMGEPIAQDTKPQSEQFRTKNTSESKKCGKEEGPSTTT